MTEQKKSLSRQVAEVVGWSVRGEHPYSEARGDLNRRAYTYLLVDPNGYPIVPDETFIDDYPTEDAAWEHAPDFEHDAAACIAALDVTGENWHHDSTVILGKRRHMITIAGYYATHSDFCEAACKALIKWRKWKDTQR